MEQDDQGFPLIPVTGDCAFIEGFDDYCIFDTGHVYSFKEYNQGKGRFLNTPVDNIGYPMASFYFRNKGYHRRVHRLVAKAFLPEDPNRPEVDHRDNDRTNPAVNNLRWCTHRENHIFSNWSRDRLNASNTSRRKLTPDQVCAIRDDNRTCYAIAKDYGVDQTTIRYIKKGLTYKDIQ